MPKTKEQKKEEVKNIAEKLEKMKIGVFTSYTGLTVSELEELRSELRKQGIEYQAAKKSLMKVALEDKKLSDIDFETLKGSLAMAFGYEDEIAAPKVLDKFKKSNNKLEILGGIYEDKFIPQEKVFELAKIPGREELLTQFIWAIKGPISNFNNVLNGNIRGLINVLNGVKEKANS